MTEAPVLELRGVSKSFGAAKVLSSVSFTMRQGERLAVIGPNGAGKTTLINLITGLYSCDSGAVLLHGRDITSLPAHRRLRLGMARSFQKLSLFDGMTVAENIRQSVLRYHGVHAQFWRRLANFSAIAEEAGHVAALMGLAAVADQPVATLAYGLRRRLDIALVLAQRPALMILDEPAAGLSAAETRELVAVLKAAAGACTLIIVEHDMDVVRAVAERVMVLDYGSVLAAGTPAEISAHKQVRQVYLGEAA
jgi:branched-chain amino acid transport system ATP-binding protein